MKNKLLLTFLFITFGFIFSTVNSNKIFAATCTWNGSDDNNLGNSANWDVSGGCTGAPVDGDDLVFPSTATSLTVNNPTPGFEVNSMAIDGNYSLGGSPIVLTNGYTSTSNQPFIAFDITLAANQTFEAGTLVDNTVLLNGFNLELDSTNGNLVVMGDITGNGNITASGTNNHSIGLMGTNNFVGTIDAVGNDLYLASDTALGNSANVLTVRSTALYVTLNNGITIPNEINFEDNTTLLNSVGDNELTGDLVLGANDVTFGVISGTTLSLSGSITGSGTITTSGPGTIVSISDDSGFSGLLTLGGGTYINNGNHPGAINLISSATLGGAGAVGTVTAYEGNIAPGNSPGILTVNGDLALTSVDTIFIEINGTTVETQYDQINVTGTANLADAVLSLSLGYVPALGDMYTILQAAGGVTGIFNGLPPGANINLGGYNFTIGYFPTSVFLIRDDELSLPVFNLSTNSAVAGSPVTINFTWAGTGPVPTGSVDVLDGTTVIGTVTLDAGSGSVTVSNLPVGTHTITIQYSGDGIYNAAISGPLSLIITAPLSNTGINTPIQLIILSMFVSLVILFKLKKKYE